MQLLNKFFIIDNLMMKKEKWLKLVIHTKTNQIEFQRNYYKKELNMKECMIITMVRHLLGFNGTRYDLMWSSPLSKHLGLENFSRAVGRIFLCLKGHVIHTNSTPCCLDNVKKHKICILTINKKK
jgi:hypothetical protein